jgi:hypothetical protein
MGLPLYIADNFKFHQGKLQVTSWFRETPLPNQNMLSEMSDTIDPSSYIVAPSLLTNTTIRYTI